MTDKVRGLKRLANVYGQVEKIRSLEVRAAATEVAQVTQALSQEATARVRQQDSQRAALLLGDREGWAVAAAQVEIAEVRQMRLKPVQAEREVLFEKAAVAHRASRQRMEQIDGIVDKAREREMETESRRMQAAADDRYLSRRLWLESHAKKQA